MHDWFNQCQVCAASFGDVLGDEEDVLTAEPLQKTAVVVFEVEKPL